MYTMLPCCGYIVKGKIDEKKEKIVHFFLDKCTHCGYNVSMKIKRHQMRTAPEAAPTATQGLNPHKRLCGIQNDYQSFAWRKQETGYEYPVY